MPTARRGGAVLSLLGGAALWGVIWYPYRKLQEAGIGGALATLTTYGVALLLASLMQWRVWLELRRQPALMLGIALGAGWSIVGYVVAVLHAEVVRVLLLFYLAPLWTLPLAHIFLKEFTARAGYLVLALALVGAMIMLWDPATGLPLPNGVGEWLALSSGFAFACSNVCVRKAKLSGVFAKSIAVWLGSVVIAAAFLAFDAAAARVAAHELAGSWAWIAGIGAAVFAMSVCIQYGLTHLPAAQAQVIMLFELVVAAAAAYWLAGETLSPRDWIGGAMIIGAGLCSDRLVPRLTPPRQQRV